MRFHLIIAVIVIMFPCLASSGSLKNSHLYTDVQYCDAIRIAEGVNSKYPYGILKKYKTTTPRQSCLNTVKHKRQDWIKLGKKGEFIDYLGSKYAPTGNIANDPKHLNNNWIGNISSILERKFGASRI